MGKFGHNPTFWLQSMPAARGRGLKIGLIGGSFNPPHAGHLQIANHVQKALGLDCVWWLVSPGNPLKNSQELASLEQRCAQVKALIDRRRMDVCTLESALGTRFSVDVIEHLIEHFPAIEFVWIMGGDSAQNFHKWKSWQKIAHLLPIVIVDRPKHSLAMIQSRFAKRFAMQRLQMHQLKALSSSKAPAWGVLYGRKNPISSTVLRKKLQKM